MCPLSKLIVTSAKSTIFLSCVEIIMIRFFFIEVKYFLRSSILSLSNAEVGSSNRIIEGLCTNARISVIFCFSPPDRVMNLLSIGVSTPFSNLSNNPRKSIGQATATQPSFEDCVVYALPRYSVSMRNLLFLCVKLFIGSSYAMWLSHYESSFTMRLMLHETVRHGESYTLIRPS